MNGARLRRGAALTGLALAGAVALWWLGSTRLALERGSDAARSADDALQALWLARGVALAVLGPRCGVVRDWRPAAGAGLALLAASWPLLLLAWSASAVPLGQAARAEGLLLVAALALPLLGQGLRHLLRSDEAADLAAVAAGVAVAAACLLVQRGLWAVVPG